MTTINDDPNRILLQAGNACSSILRSTVIRRAQATDAASMMAAGRV